jgi:hypothetical protein
MQGVRIVAVAAALGFAIFWGYVIVGGDPTSATVAAVGAVVCVAAAGVLAIGRAKQAARVAIGLGIASGLVALPSGALYAFDGYWLGLTAVLLIAAGLLLRKSETADTA